jgi:acyl-CoA hydrolase
MSLNGLIKSEDHVFVHGGAATPSVLIDLLVSQASELKAVTLYHLHTHGEVKYAKPDLAHAFRVVNLFVGANIRPYLDYDRIDYLPCFLSEIGSLFKQKKIKLDVALVHVSPPDAHGFCSLGTSVDVARAAVDSAKTIIAQVNPQMPRTFGDGILHVSEIDYLVEVDVPIYAHEVVPFTKEEEKIGGFIASLIEDRSTLQMGIGSIPDAALSKLKNHKDLGIHSEMFSDGVIDLIESGVITCNYKGTLRGRILATFLMGSKRLYDFVNDNPFIEMKESSMVNDTARIRKNPKMVAINSAIEVDVTGQVCADSIGAKMYSGVGGQMDFIRGASLSEGGKAIIALPSITKRGESRIVPYLKQGAGVVTTRSHVQYIITENGIADLYGKTLKQRTAEMIRIAHPNHQESIEKAYYEMLK